jgi:hypothetical protein
VRERLARRLLAALLVAVASVAVAAWLLLAVTHIGDRYEVTYRQSAWVALAAYANDGVWYPPLYDGERYGGTRWMPGQIGVNAAAARMTGEYLVSGKAVALVVTAVLLALLVTVLVRAGAPWPVAAALAGVVVATDTGRLAGTTIGGDALPALLQLAAVALLAARISQSARLRRILGLAGVGVLAGLAFATKTTALWALLTAVTLLAAQRRWRDLAVVVGAAAATAGSDNVIRENTVIANDRGLSIEAGGNLLLQNSAANNSLNYFISGTQTQGPIVSGQTEESAHHWANFDF